jgi:nucleoside-diphosphate-sugar epimerase
VRDVAKSHILAAEKEEASGRHILVAGSKSFPEMVEILKSKFGNQYAFPMMTAPKWLISIIAPMMGVTREFIHRNVGYPFSFDNSYSKKDLGMNYRPIESTLLDHFQQLVDDGIMDK